MLYFTLIKNVIVMLMALAINLMITKSLDGYGQHFDIIVSLMISIAAFILCTKLINHLLSLSSELE